MREFLLYSRNGVTSPDFNLKDLPGSGGRMDLICRSIISALWLSNDMREDTKIKICLNGPPDPPLSICFDGSNLKKLSPDERSIAIWLKKCLKYKDLANDFWMETHDGIFISKQDFYGLLDEIRNYGLYLLHREGEDIKEVKIEEDSAFILGDNIGLPNDILERCRERGEKKISVGPKEYFTSQSITLVHNEIDRIEKNSKSKKG